MNHAMLRSIERESNRKIEKEKDNHRTIHAIDENSNTVCLRKTKNSGGLHDPTPIHHWSRDRRGAVMGSDMKTYTRDSKLSMWPIRLIERENRLNNSMEVRAHLIQRYWLHEVYTLRKARSEENVAEEFEKKTRIHIQTRNWTFSSICDQRYRNKNHTAKAIECTAKWTCENTTAKEEERQRRRRSRDREQEIEGDEREGRGATDSTV